MVVIRECLHGIKRLGSLLEYWAGLPRNKLGIISPDSTNVGTKILSLAAAMPNPRQGPKPTNKWFAG